MVTSFETLPWRLQEFSFWVCFTLNWFAQHKDWAAIPLLTHPVLGDRKNVALATQCSPTPPPMSYYPETDFQNTKKYPALGMQQFSFQKMGQNITIKVNHGMLGEAKVRGKDQWCDPGTGSQSQRVPNQSWTALLTAESEFGLFRVNSCTHLGHSLIILSNMKVSLGNQLLLRTLCCPERLEGGSGQRPPSLAPKIRGYNSLTSARFPLGCD